MEPPDPWEALHQADEQVVQVMRRALGAYQAIHIVLDVPLGAILRRLAPELEAKTDNSGRVVVRSSSLAAPQVQLVSIAGPPPTHVQHQLYQHDEQVAAVRPESPLQPQSQIVPYRPECLQSHQSPHDAVTTNTLVGDSEAADNQPLTLARWSPRSSGSLSQETRGIPSLSARMPESRLTRRQSGMPGVSWYSRGKVWLVDGRASGKRWRKIFNPNNYRMAQMDSSAAEQAALDAAMAFRRATYNPDERAGKGIGWDKRKRCWRSYIRVKGKLIHGGSFKPKDDSTEQTEKARLLAIESRRALEQQHGRENGAAQCA